MERQPGPIVLILAVQLHDALLADQVALLADGVAERGLQRGGVDDRHVPAVDDGRDVLTWSSPGPWHRSQPIAWPRKIGGRYRLTVPATGSTRFAWQNRQSGWTGRSKWGLFLLIARGQVPPPLPGIPADRGLEEEAVALDQVGGPLVPGAEHELDLGLIAGDDAARGVPSRLLVEDMAVPALDRVLEPWASNRTRPPASSPPVAVAAIDRGEGAAHRVLAVGLGDLRMAADAGRIPHVADPRSGVRVRGGCVQRMDRPPRRGRREGPATTRRPPRIPPRPGPR